MHRRAAHLLALVTLTLGLSAALAQRGRGDDAPTEELRTSSLTERLAATGKTGIVQLLISVSVVAFALERAVHLRRRHVSPAGFHTRAIELWRQGKHDELDVHCTLHPSTLARVTALLFKHRDAPMEKVSVLAGDLASREMKLHLQRAYPLAVAATVSPLLGLFGTVYGMVGAFEAVALSGDLGNAAVMADSISYALMTTVVGLFVGIPALVLYHAFRMKTNLLAIALEEQSSEMVAEVFMPQGAGDAHRA